MQNLLLHSYMLDGSTWNYPSKLLYFLDVHVCLCFFNAHDLISYDSFFLRILCHFYVGSMVLITNLHLTLSCASSPPISDSCFFPKPSLGDPFLFPYTLLLVPIPHLALHPQRQQSLLKSNKITIESMTTDTTDPRYCSHSCRFKFITCVLIFVFCITTE